MKRYKDSSLIKKLIAAAKGEMPFDKYFFNARLVDVYSQTVVENASIGVVDGFIASVCPSFKAEAAEMNDCGGMYLAPSFIDAHMHIESTGLSPFAYCQGAVPHGTGCIVHDPMQILNIAGMDGVEAFEKMLDELPVDSCLQLPTFASCSSTSRQFDTDSFESFLEASGACAFGETDGGGLDSDSLLERLSAAGKASLVIGGHCPSMKHAELCAAAAAGLSDDHECVSFDELRERFRCGMSVMIRQGTIELDCKPLIEGVVKHGLPTGSLMFCTDDKSPKDMIENGCIDHALRIAVRCGLDPVRAISMATLNAAKHFHIDDIIGSCTPGRKANFVLLTDLENMSVSKVYYEGRLAAENGTMTEKKSYKAAKYPCFDNTVRLPKGLTAEDMTVSFPDDAVSARVEVISMPDSILTKRSEGVVRVSEGKAVPDTENDILPIVIADRSGKSRRIGKGFIHGLGIKRGAVASSAVQEGCAAAAAGADINDMLSAIREVEKMGGGAVICIGGEIVARQELSIGGILSPLDIGERIASADKFAEALRQTGSSDPRLMTALTVAPCSTIPDIGLTVNGLVDVLAGRIIPPVREVQYKDNGKKQ